MKSERYFGNFKWGVEIKGSGLIGEIYKRFEQIDESPKDYPKVKHKSLLDQTTPVLYHVIT